MLNLSPSFILFYLPKVTHILGDTQKNVVGSFVISKKSAVFKNSDTKEKFEIVDNDTSFLEGKRMGWASLL